jgi:septal ring factor EnvC (AmiA/AmiB activator)
VNLADVRKRLAEISGRMEEIHKERHEVEAQLSDCSSRLATLGNELHALGDEREGIHRCVIEDVTGAMDDQPEAASFAELAKVVDVRLEARKSMTDEPG